MPNSNIYTISSSKLVSFRIEYFCFQTYIGALYVFYPRCYTDDGLGRGYGGKIPNVERRRDAISSKDAIRLA